MTKMFRIDVPLTSVEGLFISPTSKHIDVFWKAAIAKLYLALFMSSRLRHFLCLVSYSSTTVYTVEASPTPTLPPTTYTLSKVSQVNLIQLKDLWTL